MSSNIEAPVTAEPASPPAANLPTPAESPKSSHDHQEDCGLSVIARTLEERDDCTLGNAEQGTPDGSTKSSTPAENMVEESIFVEDDTTEENRASQYVRGTDADDSDDELPPLEDLLDPEVANLIELERLGCDESDEDEDDDSDSDSDGSYENDSDSSDDDESDEGSLSEEASNSSKKKKGSKKSRQKPATNAREYVARLHAKEDKQLAKRMQREEGKKDSGKPKRKRKATEGDVDFSKVLKTANGRRFPMPGNSPSTSKAKSLLPMKRIKATTHAEQFAQTMANIPENCDTRRKGTQKRDLKEAASIFGYKKVEAHDGEWKLKGMKSFLRHHQITAVSWMVKRELGRMEPFGGILADAMGMGKTIMSLACMIGNEPDEEHLDKFCNATLVVVPNKQIAQQWQDETRKHCMPPYKHMVFIYDSQCEDVREVCRESFMVIVTYKELISQYPTDSVLRTLLEKYDSDDISFKRELDKIVGPLFRINWYRIILDEAHAIKNAESRTSRACCALHGMYRWALSGTPIANGSEEMYPYMKFLQCDWTLTPKDFRSMFFSNDEPNPQFVALTSLMMYRRTMDDEFLGHQIISLPERKEVDLWVALSKEEQVIVDAVCKHYKTKKKTKELSLLGLGMDEDEDREDELPKRRGKRKGNKKSKSKKRSTYGQAWVLARASQVRQRQAISHVYCIERLLRGEFELEEFIELREALNNVDAKHTILEQMQLGVQKDSGIMKYQKGLQMIQEREENFFGKYFDMQPLLNILGEGASVKGVNCLLCETIPVDPVFSKSCHHVYCSKCMMAALSTDGQTEQKTTTCRHEDCNEILDMGLDVASIQKIMDAAEADGSAYREPGKDSMDIAVHQEGDRNGFFITSTFDDEIPILPSTKLTAAMAVVLTWMDEAPDDKILIFTQFTGSAKMLGFMLQTLNIGFRYYYGGLASPQKSTALKAIREDSEIKVLVATLRSGGQSLNLTVANRVIIIDPWWNKTAEQQAFGRVVRIGQEKITHLVRIKTKEPIDDRIYGLQRKKALDVDRTLQDDGKPQPQVNEVELQKAFLRKKAAEEQKKNAAKAKAAKKNAAKGSPKK
ncbi:SNF2 family N-terminal domain-containing protein [Trichoderma chlorosporum]